MTTPTPAPAPNVNATGNADGNLENPAEGPNKPYNWQQPDPYDGSPTTQSPAPAGRLPLFNTDKGIIG